MEKESEKVLDTCSSCGEKIIFRQDRVTIQISISQRNGSKDITKHYHVACARPLKIRVERYMRDMDMYELE